MRTKAARAFLSRAGVSSMPVHELMRLSNRFSRLKLYSSDCLSAGCKVASAVGMGRRMLDVAGRAFNVDDALCLNNGATPSTERSGPRPRREGRLNISEPERYPLEVGLRPLVGGDDHLCERDGRRDTPEHWLEGSESVLTRRAPGPENVT